MARNVARRKPLSMCRVNGYRIGQAVFCQAFAQIAAVDPVESNKLEDARAGLTYGDSVVSLTQRLKSKWPIIKSPTPAKFCYYTGCTVHQSTNIILKSSSDYKPVPGASQTRPDTATTCSATTIKLLNRSSQIWVKQILNRVLLLLTQVVSRLHTVEHCRQCCCANRTQNRSDNRNQTIVVVHGLPRQTITAQTIIAEIISRLRHSHNLNAILQFAIEKLAQAVNADRGLIWQVVGDQLAVTHEYSASGNLCFISNRPLHSDESAAIVLEFVNHFPDESATGVISINDTSSRYQFA